MINDIKAAVKISLIIIALAAFGYTCWIGGINYMHTTLTGDMKRYNDPAIPALTKAGKFYLYSQNTTLAQWRNKQNEEK